ncbi:hypothetical protein D3C86_2261020 [compost metagenome]
MGDHDLARRGRCLAVLEGEGAIPGRAGIGIDPREIDLVAGLKAADGVAMGGSG